MRSQPEAGNEGGPGVGNERYYSDLGAGNGGFNRFESVHFTHGSNRFEYPKKMLTFHKNCSILILKEQNERLERYKG